MRILSFLTDPPVVTAILVHLEFPHTPPPISPARGPPQGDFLLDQTPAFDPTEAEPVPEFVFDQSLPKRTTTEEAGPAALPDSLSHLATSTRPSEHRHVPICLPSATHASYGDG